MNNSRYRWVIVAAGGLLGCVAIGGMFSLPVLLQPMARDTGWSVAGISSAMTIGFLAMAFSSMIWDRYCGKSGAGEPRQLIDRISAAVRPFGRQRDGRDLRADDGVRHRLVR
jgi:hypothetical protein